MSMARQTTLAPGTRVTTTLASATMALITAALAPPAASAQGQMGAMPGMDGHAGMGPGSPPPAACAATDAALPPDLAAWTDKAPLAAAATAADLPGASLTVGRAVSASLRHTAEIHYPAQPEKPGGTVSYGGLLALDVKDAGTYRIALGAAPWIDVLQDGKPLASTAHGHGPACSSVRKMVDFPLTPGRYVIQISAAADPSLGVLVTRLP
ncbi:homogentisate 1,2-dioxygenase [Caulobacter sp. KR2-114]|uniref:homogentisate 1,2-dioxygenase n=1 Tax=Caulobacter sp. KR2-114 TaxID=3400912 RepID=UPI003BFF6EA8